MELLNSYAKLPRFLDTSFDGMVPMAVGSDEDCPTDGYHCIADGGCMWDGTCTSDSCSSDGGCTSDTPQPCTKDGYVYPTPRVTYFYAEQYEPSSNICRVVWSASNIENGYYEISAADNNGYYWTKASGGIDDSSVTRQTDWITLDEFRTYSLQIIVTNGGTKDSTPKYYDVTMIDFEPFYWTYAGCNRTTGAAITGDRKDDSYGIYISATEWNNFIDILETYFDTTITPKAVNGSNIRAAHYNAIANVLGVSTISAESNISASKLNLLMDTYNALGGL